LKDQLNQDIKNTFVSYSNKTIKDDPNNNKTFNIKKQIIVPYKIIISDYIVNECYGIED
jgi:hypothetical protein